MKTNFNVSRQGKDPKKISQDTQQGRIEPEHTPEHTVDALHESQVTLDAIVNSTSDMIWAVDSTNFSILWLNRSFQNYFLQQRQRQIHPGMRVEDLFPTQDYIRLWNDLFQRALAEGAYTTEYRADTGATLFQLSFNLLQKDGEVFGISVFGRDITERTRADATLLESEQRFRQMFESHSAVMLLIEPDSGAIMDANPAALDFYGYSRDQLTHMFTQDINMLSPHEVAEARQESKSKQRDTWIFPHRLANGEIRTVAVRSSPITVNGQLLLFSIIQDVTERQQAQEQLEFLKHSIETAVDAAYWMDKDGRFVYVNEAACKALGYTRAELLQMHITDVATGATPERWRQVWQQVKDNKNYMSGSLHRRKDGSEFPVEVTSTYVRFGEQEYCNGFARDITERKQAEDALTESEQKFSTLFEKAAFAIALSTLSDGVIVNVNESFETIFGYTRQEAIGKTSLELGFNPDPEGRAPTLAELKEHGFARNLELRLRVKSGELRLFSVNLDFVNIGDQKYILNMTQDITERKRAEDALRTSEQTAHQMADSLRMVNEISTKITSGLDLERLLQALYEECQRIGDTDQFYVSLYDDATEILSFPFNYENGQRSPIASRPNHTVPGFTEYILEHRQTLHIADTHVLPPEGALNRKQDEPTRSYIGVPLMIKDRVVGALSMQSHLPNAYTPEQIQTLELLATQAAIAIHNAQLFEQSQQEIAERKQAEDKLRAQTERLNLATRSAGIGIWDWDIQKNKLIWDDRMYVLYGIKPGDFGGAYEAWLNGLHPDDRDRNDELTSQVLRGEREFDTEFRVVWPDGSIHWLKANGQVFWDHDRQPLHMVGVNYDITERRQAEEKLRQSEALYRQAIEVSGAVPYLQTYQAVGTHVRYDFIGEGIREITGYGPEEFSSELFDSLTLKRLVVEELAGYSWVEAVQHVRSGEYSTWKCEHCIRARNGEIRWVFEAAVELRDENGISHGSIGLFQDITERKRAEEEWLNINVQLEERVAERTAELNHSNVELERANQTKGEFLATMSHELRSPLNSILGLSEALLEQRRGSLNESQQRSLQIIESSGQHLLSLINDILDLSKMESGKFDCYPEVIAIDDICNSSLAFVKSQAVRKSIQIQYSNETGVTQCSADPRRLKQILVNLLTNAVKFTPEKGHITLQINANEEQNLLQLSVIDDGIGIAQKDLLRLFQPFVQVESQLNRSYEGTGLGLALVQKLTDLHGGSVKVESEPGMGSRFTINLPWIKEMFMEQSSRSGEDVVTTKAEKESTRAEEHQPRGSILLAEDNPANIVMIAEYLESYGYEVTVAHNGLEALEQAETKNPDIILMDIQMPAMDGLEATRRLRANPRFTAKPIIALTALAMPGDRERCLEAGASEYMSKPVSLKTLAKTIETMLSA